MTGNFFKPVYSKALAPKLNDHTIQWNVSAARKSDRNRTELSERHSLRSKKPLVVLMFRLKAWSLDLTQAECRISITRYRADMDKPNARGIISASCSLNASATDASL